MKILPLLFVLLILAPAAAIPSTPLIPVQVVADGAFTATVAAQKEAEFDLTPDKALVTLNHLRNYTAKFDAVSATVNETEAYSWSQTLVARIGVLVENVGRVEQVFADCRSVGDNPTQAQVQDWSKDILAKVSAVRSAYAGILDSLGTTPNGIDTQAYRDYVEADLPRLEERWEAGLECVQLAAVATEVTIDPDFLQVKFDSVDFTLRVVHPGEIFRVAVVSSKEATIQLTPSSFTILQSTRVSALQIVTILAPDTIESEVFTFKASIGSKSETQSSKFELWPASLKLAGRTSAIIGTDAPLTIRLVTDAPTRFHSTPKLTLDGNPIAGSTPWKLVLFGAEPGKTHHKVESSETAQLESALLEFDFLWVPEIEEEIAAAKLIGAEQPPLLPEDRSVAGWAKFLGPILLWLLLLLIVILVAIWLARRALRTKKHPEGVVIGEILNPYKWGGDEVSVWGRFMSALVRLGRVKPGTTVRSFNKRYGNKFGDVTPFEQARYGRHSPKPAPSLLSRIRSYLRGTK